MRTGLLFIVMTGQVGMSNIFLSRLPVAGCKTGIVFAASAN
jgi:hypothetical protein